MELRRFRVGEASGVVLRPGRQLGQAGRRPGHTRGVGVESQLGHAPGRFHAVDGLREVDARRRLADGVDQRVVRQPLAPRAEQQALALQRQEVLAVDPGQIGRAAAAAAGSLLGAHPPDELGGVGELDMFELDAPTLGKLAAGPLQVGVDALAAAPGVEVHRLAARRGLEPGPVAAGLLRAGPDRQRQRGGGEQQGAAAQQGLQGGCVVHGFQAARV